MTIYTFGTGVDAAAYVEDSGSVTNPPQRPTASYPLKVRNYADASALPDATISAGTGYWSYTTTDIPIIEVSADSGVNWEKQIAIEAQIAGANAGATAASALAAATAANLKAQQALDASASAGVAFTLADPTGTVVGPAKTFTVQQLHLRTTDVPLSVNDFSDLPTVAVSGNAVDLNDFASPNGAAPLGPDGKVPASYLPGSLGGGVLTVRQNPDVGGTFPARTTVTSDPTQQVLYDPWYQFDKRPPIGTDLATAYAMNPAAGIPGDEVYLYGS